MTVTSRGDEPRLTVFDVDAATFPLTPWGRRGYDPDAVDGFLDRVRAGLAGCAAEAAGLRDEAARLRRRFVASQRGNPEDWLADASEAHAAAVAIASEGQVAVDRMVAGAQEYCARLTADAQRRREEMLAEAGRVLADARAQARDAADAALDEPVPGPADGPLRAARAAAAYQGTFNGVYLTHVGLLVDTLQQMIRDWKLRETGGRLGGSGREPQAPDPSPVTGETAETAAGREEAR